MHTPGFSFYKQNREIFDFDLCVSSREYQKRVPLSLSLVQRLATIYTMKKKNSLLSRVPQYSFIRVQRKSLGEKAIKNGLSKYLVSTDINDLVPRFFLPPSLKTEQQQFCVFMISIRYFLNRIEEQRPSPLPRVVFRLALN